VIHDIRSQVYEQLQRLSVAYYDKREVGAVMSRVQNDVGMLQNFCSTQRKTLFSPPYHSRRRVDHALQELDAGSGRAASVPFVIIGTNRYWRGLMKLWRRVWHQNSSLGARLADTSTACAWCVPLPRKSAKSIISKQKRPIARRHNERRAESGHLSSTLGCYYGHWACPSRGFWRTAVFSTALCNWVRCSFFTVVAAASFMTGAKALTRLVNFTTRAMTAAERGLRDSRYNAGNSPERHGALSMPHV
jgi:ABC-type multidrug transport system fused ATPase/permease subunit